MKFTKKEIANFVDNFINLANSDDIDEKEKFVNIFMNVIYLFNDRTFIYLNNDDDEINSIVSYEEMSEHNKTFFDDKSSLNYDYDNNSKKCSDISVSGLPRKCLT